MSAGGLILGVVNAGIVAIVLLLVGAIIEWGLSAIASIAVPANVRKLYLIFVAAVFVYMILAVVFGLPTVRIL